MSNSFKKSEEWNALLNLLKQGKKDTTFQPILWVGAGLSVPAGYPTTDELVGSLKESSLKELPLFSPNDVTLPIDSISRSFTLWINNFAKVNSYSYLYKSLASVFSAIANNPTATHLELVNNREKKVIETDKFTLLDLRNKESLLSDIAFWMTSNGKTSITPDILKQRLKSKSKDMPELWRHISAEELQLFFLERSGLLVQVGLNEIQFTHRTFQEFYTAKYIISENDTECLSKNAGNDYWNGTIQLAIGLRTSKTENEKYLTELLSKAKDFELAHDLNSATSLHLLVLSCKENMREITPRFSYQLKEVIKKVVPPPTAKARDALASAGNIAIPYLARPKGGRSIINDHYCALALIKIATPDAYIMLKDYFKDNRFSYIRKLCTDIKKMDYEVTKDSKLAEAIIADGIDEYDQSIRVMLSFLTQEEALIEDGISQDKLLDHERRWKLNQGLSPLAKLDETEVVELDLSSCRYSDLNIINTFSKLASIDLSYSRIDRLPSLVNLPNINNLDLTGVTIHHLNSLSGLRTLSNLKVLDLSMTNIEDISFISDLTMLEELYLEHTEIDDLSPLTNLKRLKKLNVSSVAFEDINVFSSLNELTSLNLSYCFLNDMDLSSLGSLVNLINLDLDYSEVSDIQFLEKLPLLNELNLSSNAIVDISVLKNLKELSKLVLSNNEIVDISVLTNLKKLNKLDLSQNEVIDVSILGNLKKLRNLDLSENNVKNIEPLSSLKEMRVINLGHTKTDSLKALEKLDKLVILDLSGLKNIDCKPIMHLPNIKHIQVGYSVRKSFNKNDFISKPYIS